MSHLNDQLLDENAALVALLRTCEKPDTWASIADTCVRNRSAIRVLEHRIDPKSVSLTENDEHDAINTYNAQAELFSDDEIPPTAARAAELRTQWNTAKELVRSWSETGLDFVSIFDERFPVRLRTIVDMPPFVFASGLLKPQDPAVSVVGSRHCTPEGALFARQTAAMLVSKGLTVIAGLAAGIDTEAHREALRLGGRTVAFIGTGITRSYPLENHELQQRIASPQSGGLVLSQFWPDTAPTKHTFPMRNALMSGYGLASVIIEASEYSGTRVQARLAQRHGRPVILRREVAEQTRWGHELVGKPGVHIVDSVEEVAGLIDHLLYFDRDVDSLISQILGNEPSRVFQPETRSQ